MYTVIQIPAFAEWLRAIKDRSVQVRLMKRLRKVQLGNLGDVKQVGNGVWKMRELLRAYWRLSMTKKIKLSDCRPFDIAEYLDDEAMITEYMNSVLEENDPAMLASALGDIARARGMSQLAKETGLSRESLYKGLSGERIPSTETLLKVIHALGFKLSVSKADSVIHA